MTANEVLEAAVIGLGVGEKHIAGFEQDQRCQVSALCDIDQGKLAQVGNRYPGKRLTTNPEEILTDPSIDVVSIASYDDAHYEQVIKAIANDKHVFVEKPLCLHDAEYLDISRALAWKPNIRLSSNLILRRSPRFLALRQRIKAGELGQLYYAEADYNYGRLEKIVHGWRGAQPYYSVVHGGAVHMVDLLLWLTGGTVREVFAYGNRIVTKDTDLRFPDLVAALLHFGDGIVAKVTANFGCVFPHFHNLSVYGDKGTFLHGHSGAYFFKSRDRDLAPAQCQEAYPATEKGDLIPSFVSNILDGTPAEVTTSDVLATMAVCLSIERSLRTGKHEIVNFMEAPAGKEQVQT